MNVGQLAKRMANFSHKKYNIQGLKTNINIQKNE